MLRMGWMRGARIAVVVGLTIATGAEADEPAWKPVAVEVGTLDPAADLHGYFDGFEHAIDGDTFEAYGQKIALVQNGTAWSYRLGDGAPVACRAWPTVVAFGEGPAKRAVWIAARGNALAWTSCYGARFKLGTHAFVMVDADADGALFEPEQDGIVGPYSRTASQFLGTAWTEGDVWELRAAGAGAEQRAFALPRKEASHPINDAWRLFNAARAAAGCRYVKWSEESARGCRAHVDYCERNGSQELREDEEKPGYSDEGDTAGRQSVQAIIYDVPREAVLDSLSTTRALSCLLSPDLAECAMAIAGRTFCANYNGDRSGPGHTGPVQWVWPPHGTRDLVLAFNDNGELPMPVPGLELDHYHDLGHAVVAKVDDTGDNFVLELTTEKGEKIGGTLTCPNGAVPDHPGIKEDNMGLVILAPDKHLPKNTVFRARLRFTLEGEREVVREWTFATGSTVYRVICPLKRMGKNQGSGSGSGSGSGRGWGDRPRRPRN